MAHGAHPPPARQKFEHFARIKSLNDLPWPAYNDKILDGFVEKRIMDERQVQVERRSGSQRDLDEFHSAGSWGLEMARTHEHEMLLAQGHFRCSHCRRADIDEMNVAARRMR
jgi:hypothetical protein